MKKFLKTTLLVLSIVGMVAVFGSTTSCSSQEDASRGRFYSPRDGHNDNVVKSKYRVVGNVRDNGKTYKTY